MNTLTKSLPKTENRCGNGAVAQDQRYLSPRVNIVETRDAYFLDVGAEIISAESAARP